MEAAITELITTFTATLLVIGWLGIGLAVSAMAILIYRILKSG